MGVNIKQNNYGSILLLQPALIQSILKEVGLGPRMALKTVPMLSQKILQPYPDSKVFNNCFHYWLIMGKLDYLAMLTCPDIQFVIHSCVSYCTCPNQEHGEAVEYIDRYLKGASKVGMLFYSKRSETFKVYADADFASNWLKEYA